MRNLQCSHMRGSSGNTNTNTNTNTQIQIHNNEELATFLHERIEQPTRNSQTRREKVGEPMARKATEKQRICIVSFQWGNMILNEHFLVKTSDGLCLQMNTYCAFRKQAENFYLEIFVLTQVGGRERCELRFCQTWQQRVWLRRCCNVHICIMYCICVCIM